MLICLICLKNLNYFMIAIANSTHHCSIQNLPKQEISSKSSKIFFVVAAIFVALSALTLVAAGTLAFIAMFPLSIPLSVAAIAIGGAGLAAISLEGILQFKPKATSSPVFLPQIIEVKPKSPKPLTTSQEVTYVEPPKIPRQVTQTNPLIALIQQRMKERRENAVEPEGEEFSVMSPKRPTFSGTAPNYVDPKQAPPGAGNKILSLVANKSGTAANKYASSLSAALKPSDLDVSESEWD